MALPPETYSVPACSTWDDGTPANRNVSDEGEKDTKQQPVNNLEKWASDLGDFIELSTDLEAKRSYKHENRDAAGSRSMEATDRLAVEQCEVFGYERARKAAPAGRSARSVNQSATRGGVVFFPEACPPLWPVPSILLREKGKQETPPKN